MTFPSGGKQVSKLKLHGAAYYLKPKKGSLMRATSCSFPRSRRDICLLVSYLRSASLCVCTTSFSYFSDLRLCVNSLALESAARGLCFTATQERVQKPRSSFGAQYPSLAPSHLPLHLPLLALAVPAPETMVEKWAA